MLALLLARHWTSFSHSLPGHSLNLAPVPDQSPGQKGQPLLWGNSYMGSGDPTHRTGTLGCKGKDQKSREKRSLREWSTGEVAMFCSCRSPARESSHGSPWSSG